MQGDSSIVERMTATNEYIIWREASITSFQAIAHFWPDEPVSPFSIYTSSDGKNWASSYPAMNRIAGDWLECVFTLSSLSMVNYVKIVWNDTSGQVWNPILGAVTITY